MIKYFRLFSECFCDLILFDNHNYESSVATDHFFRNQFENLSNNLIYNNDVITFDEYIKYLTNHITDVKAIYQFLDGINPVENRLRWNRLQIFHIVIMSFLNSYGYDFQYTNSKKMKIITKNIGGFKLIGNFENLIIRDGFARNKELKKIIKVIRS